MVENKDVVDKADCRQDGMTWMAIQTACTVCVCVCERLDIYKPAVHKKFGSLVLFKCVFVLSAL